MANTVTSALQSAAFPIYPSAARTATPDTAEFEISAEYLYGAFVFDVTVGSTLLLTFKVEAVDRVSGKTYTLISSAANGVTGVSTNVYKVGPALPVAANVSANDFLPSAIRVTVTHGNATSCTYTAAALLA